MIGRDGVEVNRAFSAGTFRVSRDLGRTPQAGNEFCAFGAKHRPKIPHNFLRTHLISRERVRCWRFGAAARREEEEYPLWIFDQRATPLRRQRSATLWAKLWRAAGCVAPQSQSALAMLLRRALPAAHQSLAHSFPTYEMGSKIPFDLKST
jgi:hypothetical protein